MAKPRKQKPHTPPSDEGKEPKNKNHLKGGYLLNNRTLPYFAEALLTGPRPKPAAMRLLCHL